MKGRILPVELCCTAYLKTIGSQNPQTADGLCENLAPVPHSAPTSVSQQRTRHTPPRRSSADGTAAAAVSAHMTLWTTTPLARTVNTAAWPARRPQQGTSGAVALRAPWWEAVDRAAWEAGMASPRAPTAQAPFQAGVACQGRASGGGGRGGGKGYGNRVRIAAGSAAVQ
jgi:hypothetical protein